MKKNQLLAGAVLLSLAGWNGAAAADQVYTLNPVVVTAQRMETTEIETPATETVVKISVSVRVVQLSVVMTGALLSWWTASP